MAECWYVPSTSKLYKEGLACIAVTGACFAISMLSGINDNFEQIPIKQGLEQALILPCITQSLLLSMYSLTLDPSLGMIKNYLDREPLSEKIIVASIFGTTGLILGGLEATIGYSLTRLALL